MNKLLIVGGGIAGMSAGVYGLQSGFKTTILEQHQIAGGNCTSWRRKGYLFEGGLHWLTGSSPKTPLNAVWKNVGALNEESKLYVKDILLTYIINNQEVNLYRNPDQLEAHLISVAPEDTQEIRKLCNDIKLFMGFTMPVMDIKGVKVSKKSKMSQFDLSKMVKQLPKMLSYSKISVLQYVQRFKNPAIRGLLLNVVGDTINASSMFFTLGNFAAGDGAYVEGGSLGIAQNMANRFTSLGGEIRYSSKVEKIQVENNKVKGVIVDGELIKGDAVIVTTDTLAAIDHLFEVPLKERWMNEMRKNVKYTASTFVSFGVEANLSDLPEVLRFHLDEPFEFAETNYQFFGINNYAGYDGYAPKNCTSLTSIFLGDTYDYWMNKKHTGEYDQEKEKFAKAATSMLKHFLPQTVGKISLWDVATPLTYERYCGTKRGSWMTLTEGGDKMTPYPYVSDSTKGLYFAGQRIQPPGGMPVAVNTGRTAIQYLCKDTNTVFQGMDNK